MVRSEGNNLLHTYIYMYVIVDLDVVLCIPHGHGCDEVRFGLGCQLQVPFNMVLNDWKPFPGYFNSAHANRQTGNTVLHPTEIYQPHEVPMFPVLCINCSIKYTARSRTTIWQSKSFWFSNCNLLFVLTMHNCQFLQWLPSRSTFQENIIVLLLAWRNATLIFIFCPHELTYDRWQTGW